MRIDRRIHLLLERTVYLLESGIGDCPRDVCFCEGDTTPCWLHGGAPKLVKDVRDLLGELTVGDQAQRTAVLLTDHWRLCRCGKDTLLALLEAYVIDGIAMPWWRCTGCGTACEAWIGDDLDTLKRGR